MNADALRLISSLLTLSCVFGGLVQNVRSWNHQAEEHPGIIFNPLHSFSEEKNERMVHT